MKKTSHAKVEYTLSLFLETFVEEVRTILESDDVFKISRRIHKFSSDIFLVSNPLETIHMASAFCHLYVNSVAFLLLSLSTPKDLKTLNINFNKTSFFLLFYNNLKTNKYSCYFSCRRRKLSCAFLHSFCNNDMLLLHVQDEILNK